MNIDLRLHEYLHERFIQQKQSEYKDFIPFNITRCLRIHFCV